MKYKDLLQFEPITEVVKLDRTDEADYQKQLIRTFVFSDTFREIHIPRIVRNIDFTHTDESFGLQIVGNYGTGKSHLMSLISLIAENKELVDLIREEEPKKELERIAGKYKVLRFELGHSDSLWNIVTYYIEEYLDKLGIDFSFEKHNKRSYREQIQLMMGEFETKYPNQGFMVVIDEMLSFLKGRTSDRLNQDLAVLQHLGQACDRSRFKFMFGVQELIYQSPEFQFEAEMLQKVNDRYRDVHITKEDVAFIVKKRLLQKDEHQKQKIKEHLEPFLKFFTDMNARTQEYVDLYPVHPSYFENFERIRIGKSQREILKTLSNQFQSILEDEVPSDNPGLLTYDQYWPTIKINPDLMAISDVRKIKEITDTISDKIDSHFIGARKNNKQVAHRIANACAIKILQQELQKENGTTAEDLVNDLCLTNKLAEDRDFLLDIIENTANQIITATSGQYFVRNSENNEFHIRIEGGVNFDQKIIDYAASMPENTKDQYFYDFLRVILPLSEETYRTGFNIWNHTIEWKSHKTYREGYIFFGNPGEKSTTHPKQHFYMYFMPVFSQMERTIDEEDIYFSFQGLSDEFKTAIAKYGAAIALEKGATSDQKNIYRQKIKDLRTSARQLFDQEYLQITKVYYQGKETILNAYQLPGAGASKEQIFSSVAEKEFESWFHNKTPHYPKFSQLNNAVTKDNFFKMIQSALSKIINPNQANRDGEGILAGLGLWIPGRLDYKKSQYANSLLSQLKEKGKGKVLNRDEILEYLPQSDDIYFTKDYKIDAEYEFVVMVALAALGEIEISMNSGQTINANNLKDTLNLAPQDYYSFSHIKEPKDINVAALRYMFLELLGRDLSSRLKDSETYIDLVTAAEDLAKKTVTLQHKVQAGYKMNGVEIIDANQGRIYRQKFSAFSGLCDKLASYNTEAKIKNFAYSVEDLEKYLPTKKEVEELAEKLENLEELKSEVSYLQQANQYVTKDDLKNKISEAIQDLSHLIQNDDPEELKKYKARLEKLKNEYADWYLKRYLDCHISESDHTKKQGVLDSEEYQIADILSEADYLPQMRYNDWKQKMARLIVVDSKVNKQEIMLQPYQDFNPKDFENTKLPSISDLKNELSEILEEWEDTLKEIIDDPSTTRKFELLPDDQQRLLSEFKEKDESLSKTNARPIRDAIKSLHDGLIKVSISLNEIKNTFSKSYSPEDALEAFKQLIDEKTRGKERDKVRLIFKNEL